MMAFLFSGENRSHNSGFQEIAPGREKTPREARKIAQGTVYPAD